MLGGGRLRVLTVIGTRPEAIKMAPVLKTLAAHPKIVSTVCATGQHREMLQQALQSFDIEVDVDLAIMRPNQSLNAVVRRVVEGVDRVLRVAKPDRVLVHGDTSTALAAAVAAFNNGIPVAHVEAGLRSFDVGRPWPEEVNRRALDVLCDLLFATTALAKENLEAEQAPGRIVVTGNTGVDALIMTVERLDADAALRAGVDSRLPTLASGRRLILVTGHRRENIGEGLLNVCRVIRRLSDHRDLEIVYALHLNPAAQSPARELLSDLSNVHLLPPQNYLSFVRLLQRADLVLTDSGGVQEEAPALGKMVLVTRTETERPEGVAMGAARLVGSDPGRIEAEAMRVLAQPGHAATSGVFRSPYGDGRASERIVRALLELPVEEFRAETKPAAVVVNERRPAGVGRDRGRVVLTR